VFGRQWGARAEALAEEVRAKLASHAHERAVLAEAITKLESTLAAEHARRADLQLSTKTAVDNLRDSVAGHATDLAKAVEEVARMCAMLADRIEIERDERRALVEAVTLLARQAMERPTVEAPITRPRIVGGSVYASPPTTNDHEIVLIDEDANGRGDVARLTVGTAVRCRFGDGWIDGLEVCEIMADGEDVRYRLRRALDQYVLPARFERRDLDLVSDSSPPNPQGKWWQS
jgi:hypothetical protein